MVGDSRLRYHIQIFPTITKDKTKTKKTKKTVPPPVDLTLTIWQINLIGTGDSEQCPWVQRCYADLQTRLESNGRFQVWPHSQKIVQTRRQLHWWSWNRLTRGCLNCWGQQKQADPRHNLQHSRWGRGEEHLHLPTHVAHFRELLWPVWIRILTDKKEVQENEI